MEIKVFEYGDRYIMQQPLILELSEQSLPTAGSPPADQLVNLNVVLLIDQAGQIIYVSRESQSLLGIADNMLVGKPVTRLLPSLALVCICRSARPYSWSDNIVIPRYIVEYTLYHPTQILDGVK